MPRTAQGATLSSSPHLTAAERAFVLDLQRQSLQYFLDNQLPATGLVLDRQRNFAPRQHSGLISTAATGMGWIALALASASPYRLLPRSEALLRIRHGLRTTLERLPHVHGILPHFVDATTGAVVGSDVCSTIDSAWLLAGGLWAATFLGSSELQRLAGALWDRVDWRFWTAPGGLIRHGADAAGRLLPCCWDRLNGETIFLYLLAAGAAPDRAWPAAGWDRLGAFPSDVGGRRFASADLGLFVFQYGYDLIDLHQWRLAGERDLLAEAALAAEANAEVCRAAADRFATYRHFWGLSAGDGPGDAPEADTYRCYAPGRPLDGTAHLSATVPMLVHRPALVWENLHRAETERTQPPHGRYGFSSLNLDRHWVARDMVGIDAGAIVLALDNLLFANRIRRVFHALPAVHRGLECLDDVALPLSRAA
jgi:hypothetical protein